MAVSWRYIHYIPCPLSLLASLSHVFTHGSRSLSTLAAIVVVVCVAVIITTARDTLTLRLTSCIPTTIRPVPTQGAGGRTAGGQRASHRQEAGSQVRPFPWDGLTHGMPLLANVNVTFLNDKGGNDEGSVAFLC